MCSFNDEDCISPFSDQEIQVGVLCDEKRGRWQGMWLPTDIRNLQSELEVNLEIESK